MSRALLPNRQYARPFFLVLVAVILFLGRAEVFSDALPQVSVSAVPHTTNGYVKAGCLGLIFSCGSGATCVVAGLPLAASTSVTIPIPAQSRTNDVTYTVSGGTLYSLEVR